MKLKQIILSALLGAVSLTAAAQDEPRTVEEFNPHWYVQAQGGAQYTLGERAFGKLVSGNAQIAGGYRFNSIWGLRLAVNAWQSKGGSKYAVGNVGKTSYKWNYVAPNLDVTIDLTNLIGGYRQKRLCSVGVFAGLGCNIGFNNDEAADVKAMYVDQNPVLAGKASNMEYLWGDYQNATTDKHAWLQGHFGATCDFRVTDLISLGLELSTQCLSGHYNSKKAHNNRNCDWYFNALAGIKFNLGRTHRTKTLEPCGKTQIIERVVEKPVEKIVEKVVEKVVYRDSLVQAAPEPLRRDIFFNIRGSEVSKTEMPKVEDIVTYLNRYPKAKVCITGYADRGTGNPTLNKGYAEKRAQIVAYLLEHSYGIAKSRICVDSKGDTEQPYADNDLNRVSICVAE